MRKDGILRDRRINKETKERNDLVICLFYIKGRIFGGESFVNVLAEEKSVKVLGRTLMLEGVRYLNFSGAAIEFEFTGTKAEAVLWTDGASGEEIFKAWMAVFINEEEVPSKRFSLDVEEDAYVLYEGAKPEKVKIRLVKMSEAAFSKVGVKSITIDSNQMPVPTAYLDRKIEFIGDSITCGYGNEGVLNTDVFCTAQENPWDAYAAKTARHFHADYHLISWSGIGIISNWVSETEDKPLDHWLMPMLYQYTDAALSNDRKIENPEVWDHKRFIPDVIVINLGTNDTSYTRGIKERVNAFGEKYYQFLDYVRNHNVNTTIICTLGVMGQELCPEIQRQVEKFTLEKQDDNIHFMEFEVQKESDGIGADWHPSLLTHAKMSERLIAKIREVKLW